MAGSTWVLASCNEGKLQELNYFLHRVGRVCVPQSACGVPQVDEPFQTFLENALHKARHASCHAGLPALADDSGLCVPALDLQPGVRSARFATEEISSEKNMEKVLRLLSEHEKEGENSREAFLYCVLVLVRKADDPCPIFAEGLWRGLIAPQPMGRGGFGYDPIFYLPEHDGTVAELPSEIKQIYSHRAQALKSLLNKVRLDASL